MAANTTTTTTITTAIAMLSMIVWEFIALGGVELGNADGVEVTIGVGVEEAAGAGVGVAIGGVEVATGLGVGVDVGKITEVGSVISSILYTYHPTGNVQVLTTCPAGSTSTNTAPVLVKFHG